MREAPALINTLLAILDGARFVNALRRNGNWCRIVWPGDLDAQRALLRAHLCGTPMNLTFHANGKTPWDERVDAVVLAAFCPAADGHCRWIGFDLDATDHGTTGLADPSHAVRVIAERADAAGLSAGLFVARSRRGQGRHVFLLFDVPIALADAVIGVAALAAAAWTVASQDVADCDAKHAFRRANESIAQPGDVGAFELVPRSTSKPPIGWALTLPAAGSCAPLGGGLVIDPFTNQPCDVVCAPRCDIHAWSRHVTDARNELAKRTPWRNWGTTPQVTKRSNNARRFFDRLDPRTREFLDGRIAAGNRNNAAFAAAANLLGCGADESEAQRLVMAGGLTCGLSERETRSAFHSAQRSLSRKRGSS